MDGVITGAWACVLLLAIQDPLVSVKMPTSLDLPVQSSVPNETFRTVLSFELNINLNELGEVPT